MHLALSTMHLTLVSAKVSSLLEPISMISFSPILAIIFASNPEKASLRYNRNTNSSNYINIFSEKKKKKTKAKHQQPTESILKLIKGRSLITLRVPFALEYLSNCSPSTYQTLQAARIIHQLIIKLIMNCFKIWKEIPESVQQIN